MLEEATGNSALDHGAARTLLGCLLFQRDAVLKRVGALSGGEKVRPAPVGSRRRGLESFYALMPRWRLENLSRVLL